MSVSLFLGKRSSCFLSEVSGNSFTLDLFYFIFIFSNSYTRPNPDRVAILGICKKGNRRKWSLIRCVCVCVCVLAELESKKQKQTQSYNLVKISVTVDMGIACLRNYFNYVRFKVEMG